MTNHAACDHSWTIERYLGAKTGDEICSKCGDERPRQRKTMSDA